MPDARPVDRVAAPHADRARSRAVAITDARVVLCEGAKLTAQVPVTIQTAPSPWAYAATIPIDPGSADVVAVTLHVRAGSVLLATAPLDLGSSNDDTVLHQTDAPVSCSLFAPPSPGCVLVRNGPDPMPATVVLHFIVCRPLTPAEQQTSTLDARLVPSPSWQRYYGTRGDSIRDKVRLRAYEALAAPVAMRWLEGLTVVIQPRQQMSRAVYVSGVYEPNTALAIKRLLPAGATFIDVGANAGLFTMLGSRWVGPEGRVYAFEPSPRERARLAQHVDMNALTNVTVVAAAVGERVNEVVLRVAADEYGGLNTTGPDFAYPGVPLASEITVPLTTLDAWAADARVASVALIKIDVEGGEVAVLRGAAQLLRRCRPAVVFELFSGSLRQHGTDARELERFLRELDYRLFRIDDATADLHPIPGLESLDEQNVVALPSQ